MEKHTLGKGEERKEKKERRKKKRKKKEGEEGNKARKEGRKGKNPINTNLLQRYFCLLSTMFSCLLSFTQ